MAAARSRAPLRSRAGARRGAVPPLSSLAGLAGLAELREVRGQARPLAAGPMASVRDRLGAYAVGSVEGSQSVSALRLTWLALERRARHPGHRSHSSPAASRFLSLLLQSIGQMVPNDEVQSDS